MEYIDDHPVVSYQIRFKNRADISEADAAHLKDGNLVVWLVRTVCEPPSYQTTTKDSPDRRRFNVQAVEEAVPLEGELRSQAVAYLEHGGDQGFINFDVPQYPEDVGNELAEIRALLAERDVLQSGESPVDCLRRVLPTPVFALQDRNDVAPLGSDDPSVEVVGSIYPGGKSRDRQLIEEMFP